MVSGFNHLVITIDTLPYSERVALPKDIHDTILKASYNYKPLYLTLNITSISLDLRTISAIMSKYETTELTYYSYSTVLEGQLFSFDIQVDENEASIFATLLPLMEG